LALSSAFANRTHRLGYAIVVTSNSLLQIEGPIGRQYCLMRSADITPFYQATLDNGFSDCHVVFQLFGRLDESREPRIRPLPTLAFR
jgi:hypothetical protein